MFFACNVMISRSLHHSAKILCHEVDLMQDHSVQQSVAETCSKVLLFTL